MPLMDKRGNKTGVPLVKKFLQSPRNWFYTLNQSLHDIGFRPLKSDPCLYIDENEVDFVMLTLHVDDLLLLGAKTLLFNRRKKQAMDRFEITDIVDVSRVLGMNATPSHEKGGVTIDRKEYAENVIERFGMKACNPTCTPRVVPELFLEPSERKLAERGGQKALPIYHGF